MEIFIGKNLGEDDAASGEKSLVKIAERKVQSHLGREGYSWFTHEQCAEYSTYARAGAPGTASHACVTCTTDIVVLGGGLGGAPITAESRAKTPRHFPNDAMLSPSSHELPDGSLSAVLPPRRTLCHPILAS